MAVRGPWSPVWCKIFGKGESLGGGVGGQGAAKTKTAENRTGEQVLAGARSLKRHAHRDG